MAAGALFRDEDGRVLLVGKPEPCYRALLSAERAAAAEVSYRPPVHRMTKELLRADRRRSLPGLRAFVHRIGVPDA